MKAGLLIGSILEVFAFEIRRTLTAARSFNWLALALFPAILLLLVRVQSQMPIPLDRATFAIFLLVPLVSCLLGLLLWTTPAVQSEMEGQTWIYLAVRPHGKVAVLLGKYLVAIVWTISAGIFSVTACVLASQTADAVRLWSSMCILVILSSISYGALYLLIGVIATRRASVVAVAYTLLVEMGVSVIPATINKLTINHRLQSIMVDMMELEGLRSRASIFFGEKGSAQHIAFLIGYTLCLLAAVILVLRFKEIPMNSDT